jgi:hypothetical protein
MQTACVVLYCHLWSVLYHHISPHYFINGMIFREKKLLNIKRVFSFSLQLLSETFLIVRITLRDININVHTCACKSTRYSCHVTKILIFSADSKNFEHHISSKSELIHTDGRTDGHDEAESLFTILRTRLKARLNSLVETQRSRADERCVLGWQWS